MGDEPKPSVWVLGSPLPSLSILLVLYPLLLLATDRVLESTNFQSCIVPSFYIPNERVSPSTHFRGGDEDPDLTGWMKQQLAKPSPPNGAREHGTNLV